jgi:hypothetical protein
MRNSILTEKRHCSYFFQPGKPNHNAGVDRFNSSFRDGVLNEICSVRKLVNSPKLKTI